MRCFDCIGGMFITRTMKCAVNPIIGREFESSISAPSRKRKKVLIAGGGPDGMQAAITASEQKHDVTLYEKMDSLGGTIKFAKCVSFKGDLDRFREYQARKVSSLGVKVHLNSEVTPELVSKESPDILIAAIVAEPIIPEIQGIDRNLVVTATDAYNKGAEIGKNLAVIGGGLMGCEKGLHLAQQGKDVTIIEMLDEVAKEVNIMHRRALVPELEKYTKIKTGFRCTEVIDKGVKAVDKEGKELLFEADSVIVAVGLKSKSDLVDAL